ncbi:hypothetical protein PG993_010590 [Apiospora rasikravindrae]|uniref:Tetratricopeptide repeat protein n=1 Tax=Apiospora rasikravindrae TaxID=990691 RepID=A0ABR1SMR4_9PEZI
MFSLSPEEKSSLQSDIDALIASVQTTLAGIPNPSVHDHREALRILGEVSTMSRDLKDEEDEEDDEGEQDGSATAHRARALKQSQAEAAVLRGDILRALGQIPEARAAYTEAISQYPDDFPPADAHASLTSRTRRPSLIPRPSSSSASTHKRSVRPKPIPPPNAAKRAWTSLIELSYLEDPAAPTTTSDTTRRNSTPSGNAAMSKRDKRRAGVWSAGYYESGSAPAPESSGEAVLKQHIEQQRWDSAADPAIQDVGAQKMVRIVERDEAPSGSSASLASVSDRSIQYKKKCGDLRSLRSQAQERR